ncbi:type 4b pilus protein PilO2 [Pseudomonas sp. S75]|uniref:type 4b pilus protein PilO2 n=1 Tax=Pseudomonas sp. S75 TaxID=2767446 RepID=UPI00190AF6FF|nr:type 4b pilus protein PilO2 [Pseudomonas sp. S75]MBK0155597.1 type 4b pilus protein PilO2 [Pseudomonas sp. S75]
MNTDTHKPSSRVQTIQHRGRVFVTGMLWTPLGNMTSYMKEARQYGHEHGLDIVAIRRTSLMIQAGFVSRSADVHKGMYSLAATLAGQLGDSWIAAWAVDADQDRYAIVAVHEGRIIPGCDLIATASEVRKRVLQQRSRGIQFEREFLPTEFGMGGDLIDIDELLQPSRLKREYRLRPLVFGMSKPELAQLLLVALLIGGGLLAWSQWKSHQAEIARQAAIEAEKKRLEELAELQRQTGTEQPIQALEHPWAKQPSVTDFVEACSRFMNRLPLSIRGWPFMEAKCNSSQVIATYERAGNSTAHEFTMAVAELFSIRPELINQGKTGLLKFDIPLDAAGDDALIEARDALENLTSWFHGFSQEPQLKPIPVVTPQEPALPGQPTPPPPPPPQWQQYQLSYTSGVLPYDSFNGAPTQGLRLQEIKTEYKADHLIWSVTGVLYAK